MKKVLVLITFLLLTLSGCGSKKNPIVTMEFDTYGTIEIELYPDIAPNTVANFVNLVEEGFYDNNTVHRIVPGFVLQGGDPTGTGTGGPNYSIKGEFTQNGFMNNLSHNRGIISMARAKSMDSAGSQFFIVLDDSAKSSLDGMYASFGKVTKGMDVIDKMVLDATWEDEENGILKNNYTIKKATVETFGQNYKVQKITG